jgi:spore coat polysaccharide biosynthesis protein SpsF
VKAVLQARMQASRLPGKVLMAVNGRPIIDYNVERLRRARHIDEVIIATTSEPADDAIAAFCAEHGIRCFRGSEADVLDRLYHCVRAFGLDVMARLTADNPLIDPAVVDGVIEVYLADPERWDYVSNNHPPTWQDGQEVEILPTPVLETAWQEADKPFQREHGSPFIWDQPRRFRVGNVQREEGDAWYHQYRWTLDYAEDFELMKRIYEGLYPAKPTFSTDDLMRWLEEHPEVMRLNSMHAGYVWYDQHRGDLQTIGERS